MWRHKLPSPASSPVPRTTCQGVGKIALCDATTSAVHAIGLQAQSVVATPTGFTVSFTKPFALGSLRLFEGVRNGFANHFSFAIIPDVNRACGNKCPKHHNKNDEGTACSQYLRF